MKLRSIVSAICLFSTAHAAERISIATSDGMPVAVVQEDLSGIKTRPLVKLKERADKQFHEGFLTLSQMSIKAGTEIRGTFQVDDPPVRLTVYEISKAKDMPRKLRVLASGYYSQAEVAAFAVKVEPMDEHIFFVTAEKTGNKEQLNSHLQYMNSQNGELTMKGFSTNWNLSALKFQLAGKAVGADADSFEKDGDWLIQQLIKPAWIEVIRIETK